MITMVLIVVIRIWKKREYMKSQEKCTPKVTYAVVLHSPEQHKVDVINLVFAQLALWFRTSGTFFLSEPGLTIVLSSPFLQPDFCI